MSLVVGDYPVVDGVHVCVPDDQHVASFSVQWDRWATTNVDSCGFQCGFPETKNSADIFALKTALTCNDLQGKIVLDAGCGTGRFSEIAAWLGGSMVAVDLSHAVFHAAKLLAGKGDHTFIQASLESLPLPDASVDVAFSIGVLHHTPDPAKAVREIARVLKPGGIFAGWVYEKQPTYNHPARKAWRDFSTDPAHREAVFELASHAPRLRDLYDQGKGGDAVQEAIRILPFLGTLTIRDPGEFRAIVGVSGSRNDAECRLGSFDWMSPKYQWQYTRKEWETLLTEAGFDSIQPLPFPVSWRSRRSRR